MPRPAGFLPSSKESDPALTPPTTCDSMQMQALTGGPVSCTERLTREMRQRGLRLTPQRSVILEAVAHSPGHPSALDVFHLAQDRLPGLNLATVYRALEALQSAGLIDSIESGRRQTGFALRDGDHLHHHLVCSSCGGEWEVGARRRGHPGRHRCDAATGFTCTPTT